LKPRETARQAAAREFADMSPEERDAFILAALFKKHERRIRDAQERIDIREAEAEMAGDRLPLDMPTILDMHVRVVDDAGIIDYKDRDDASPKEHIGHQEHKSAVYRTASGIADRKCDKLSDWMHQQGSGLDHAAPIGGYIWEHIRCAICGGGPEAIPQMGTFVRAHKVAFALGGEAMEWAHKRCNEMEGVG
jgi:hypothetical protein